MSEEAKRYETGVRLDLLVPEFLIEMGKIMCVGAKKYGELNWKKGGLTGEKGGVNHALHHLCEYVADSPCDYGPRETHLVQVAVNAMFEFWYERQKRLTMIPEDKKLTDDQKGKLAMCLGQLERIRKMLDEVNIPKAPTTDGQVMRLVELYNNIRSC